MARRSKTRSSTRAAPLDGLDIVFKALANADRRTLLELVRTRPRTTAELCDHLPELDRCTVMLHLQVLETARLLLTSRKGRCKFHIMNVEPVKRLYEDWIKRNLMPAKPTPHKNDSQ
ncbi:MAG: helix-turn-helix domain-containing protein [Gemmatales bacterium]